MYMELGENRDKNSVYSCGSRVEGVAMQEVV
jgi:hypothetical protein